MLSLPKDFSSHINIIGIDPGTTFLGFAILSINLDNFEIIKSEAITFNGAKLSNSDGWIESIHGDRFSRIRALENTLLEAFNFYKPYVICAESPFFGMRHPNAFQALTEVICSIRTSVYNYSAWHCLNLVPPSVVKQAVSAKGNADKHVMKEKVKILLPELKYSGSIPFDNIDEHSVDSLAIAYYAYTQLKNLL